MSEEEIIKKTNSIINNHRKLDKMMIIEVVELLMDLLDLYYKEKEENNKLRNTIFKLLDNFIIRGEEGE